MVLEKNPMEIMDPLKSTNGVENLQKYIKYPSNTGVGKIRRVMSNPHSKIDPNMSEY